MDIIAQFQALGLDGFLGGMILGILIGWNLLPMPERVKPYVTWVQEKIGGLLVFWKKPPPPSVPPSANT
jgi:hypothetical protein